MYVPNPLYRLLPSRLMFLVFTMRCISCIIHTPSRAPLGILSAQRDTPYPFRIPSRCQALHRCGHLIPLKLNHSLCLPVYTWFVSLLMTMGDLNKRPNKQKRFIKITGEVKVDFPVERVLQRRNDIRIGRVLCTAEIEVLRAVRQPTVAKKCF